VKRAALLGVLVAGFTAALAPGADVLVPKAPGALAVGPNGNLYIADQGRHEILERLKDETFIAAGSEVLRLSGGVLARIAGSRRYDGILGIGGPATRAAADSPDGLAFDRAGNLFIAGFATKALLMIGRGGTMRLVDDQFYPRGDAGLVTAPDGTVLGMETTRVVRVSPVGVRTVVDFLRRTVGGIEHFLPNGITVAPNGDVYLDTDNGNGWVNRTAIIVLHPNGRIRVLWEAPR